FIIGLNGGTYQTIGNVRYSGCNGNANLCWFANLYTGEFCAASIQSSLMPSFLACSITSVSLGSKNKSHCASYKSLGSGVDAASNTRSASYNKTPKYRIRPVHVSEQTVGKPDSILG